jgi:hypothetical protein
MLGACQLPGGSARDVVQRAVEAHGGEAKLEKTLTGRIKGSIDAKVGDIALSARLVETFQLPSQYKRSIDGEVAGKKEHMEYAFTEGRGWLMRNGEPAKELSGKELSLESHWHTMPVLLTRFLRNGSELTRVSEIVADGKTLVGVGIVKGQMKTELFFDRATGLLDRAKRGISLPIIAGDPAGNQDGEVVYSDYREVAGVKYPMKVHATAGSKMFFDVRIFSVQFLDRIDPAEFKKP